MVRRFTELAPVSPSIRISGAMDTLVSLEVGEHALAVLHEVVSNAPTVVARCRCGRARRAAPGSPGRSR